MMRSEIIKRIYWPKKRICFWPWRSNHHSASSFEFPPDKPSANQPQRYIVALRPPDGMEFATPEDRESWYNSFLFASVAGSDVKPPSIIHAYDDGFSAKLSADQVKAMEKMDGFVYASPPLVYKLCIGENFVLSTTHKDLPTRIYDLE